MSISLYKGYLQSGLYIATTGFIYMVHTWYKRMPNVRRLGIRVRNMALQNKG